jgi:hypothetical protein
MNFDMYFETKRHNGYATVKYSGTADPCYIACRIGYTAEITMFSKMVMFSFI